MLKYLCATVLAVNALKIREELESELPAKEDKASGVGSELPNDVNFASMMLKRGDCPVTETFKDLDLSRLEGEFFTHASLNLYNMYYAADCLHTKSTWDAEANKLRSEVGLDLEGRHMIIHDTECYKEEEKLVSDMFGNKLRFVGNVLDTDYDNYVIGYGCFDGMKYQFTEDGELEPVHLFMIDISTRDANTKEEEIERLSNIVFEKVPEVTKAEF